MVQFVTLELSIQLEKPHCNSPAPYKLLSFFLELPIPPIHGGPAGLALSGRVKANRNSKIKWVSDERALVGE